MATLKILMTDSFTLRTVVATQPWARYLVRESTESSGGGGAGSNWDAAVYNPQLVSLPNYFSSARLIVPIVTDPNPENASMVLRQYDAKVAIGASDPAQVANIGYGDIGNMIYDATLYAWTFSFANIATLETFLNRTGQIYRENSAQQHSKMRTARDAEILQPYIEYNYDDEFEAPVITILAPRDIVIDGERSNAFSWAYSQLGGYPQSHFEIEYQIGGQWVAAIPKTELSEQVYLVPSGTFQPGTTTYRLRVYALDGTIASEWDTAVITISGRPDTPAITAFQEIPRPTLQWSVDGQAGYRITVTVPDMDVTVYDSGTVYTLNQFWQSPMYLDDGNYEIHLQIVNQDDRWSDIVTVPIKIQNIAGAPITLTISKTADYGAMLSWQTDGVYSGYVIYRNGKQIKKTTGKQYTDYYSIGNVRYMVRGIAGSYYTDSNVDGLCQKVCNAVISNVDPINWLNLEKKRWRRPAHDTQLEPDVAYLHFENRELPQKFTSERKNKTHNFAYTFKSCGNPIKSAEEYLHLQEMLNKTVVYKDCMNQLIIGNLDAISASIDTAYDVNFQITEIDAQEGLDNE